MGFEKVKFFKGSFKEGNVKNIKQKSEQSQQTFWIWGN